MSTPTLSRSRLLLYGLPGLPLAALGLPMYVFLPAFYTTWLPLAEVGLVLLIARLWDMLSDPLVGYLGDRLRTPFGRRRVLMVAGVVPLLYAVDHLFQPHGQPGAGYLLGWSAIALFGWTLVSLPYQAWGAELSEGYGERSRVSAAREGFVILGTLAALALPVLAGVGDQPGAALALISQVLVPVLPLCVAACVLCVPEITRAPAPDLRAIRAALGNPCFRRLVGAYLLNGVANGLPATLFVIYVAEALAAPGWTGGLLAAYFAAGIVSLPVWLYLGRRLDKHRLWCISMVWVSLAFAAVPFIGPGDTTAFLVVCVLTGTGLGVDMAVPASIQADVLDLERGGNGEKPAGVYFGVWGMATKLSLALAAGVALPLLDLAGLQRGGPNGAPALAALIGLYAVAPIVIKLVAVRLMWNFPLGREWHATFREAPA